MRRILKWGILILVVLMATLLYALPLPLPTLEDTCVVDNPTQAPKDFMWGVVAYHVPLPGYDLHPEDFRKMADNGVTWISVDFAWKRIEPSRDAQYDFRYFDMLTREAARNHIQIIGRLANGYNTPARAVSPEWTAALSPNDYLASMDRYARAVVQRYGQTVKYWAMENELNIDYLHVWLGWRAHAWNPEVKDRIVEVLNRAIHESAPDTHSILTISTFPPYESYLKHITARVNYDIMGLYSYPANFLPISRGFENSTCHSATVARQNNGNRPVIWIETGYQTTGSIRTPQQQAQYVSSVARAALRSGMRGVFIYEYLDNPQEKLTREQHFGLLQADRTPKPAWTTYGKLIAQYRQSSPPGP